MSRLKLQVGPDHVNRQIGKSPQRAVFELIWNALDAGGSLVNVTLRVNNFGAIDTPGIGRPRTWNPAEARDLSNTTLSGSKYLELYLSRFPVGRQQLS